MIKPDFVKLKELLIFEEKSKRKASEGIANGTFKFFSSTINQTKTIDDADYSGENIIFGTGGSPSIHYCDEKFSTSTDCFVCKIKTGISAKYIYYYILNNIDILERGFKGIGLKHISKKYLEEIRVPIPSIEKQLEVVILFERLFKIKNEKEKITSLIEILSLSLFNDFFGDPLKNDRKWETHKLKELCDVRRGASPRPISDYIGGSVPWIKIGDATENSSLYISKTKEFLTEEGVKRSAFLKSGSLIFANSGVSLGFARILKVDGCIHDGWLSFENISPRLNKIYLLKLLNLLTDYFRAIAPNGTQPNLNTRIMKEFIVPLPPIEKQNSFSEMIESIDEFKERQIILNEIIHSLQSELNRDFFN